MEPGAGVKDGEGKLAQITKEPRAIWRQLCGPAAPARGPVQDSVSPVSCDLAPPNPAPPHTRGCGAGALKNALLCHQAPY